LGLKSQPWVKTSLAPGSKVVTEYLQASGLNEYLDSMGFNLVGYGCTTCIGNSGPLAPEIEKTRTDNHLTVVSILSGNRNFEGRVHQLVRANYLASPPLVVAYAIAGTVNIDLDKDPLGYDKNSKPVYLKDIWPSSSEIKSYIDSCITPSMFKEKYREVFIGDKNWQNILVKESDTYDWNPNSTYINNPPYFENINKPVKALNDINNAKILALFGDSITTDHISPAGAISKTSPAAKFLMDRGVSPAGFNSYGARRGNHEIMIRGTFANPRIKNYMCDGIEGGVTINYPSGKQMSIYDAAMEYKKESVPLVIFAGKEYGSGSSRDWAAKGPSLLGVKAIIAESFERIHRSNLVGMGVLPISFKNGEKWMDLNLKGDEEISILGISNNIKPYQPLKCLIKRKGGKNEAIDAVMQVYTDNEIDYIKHGSILGAVLKNLVNN
jgi:aconitate hydratase